MFYFQDLDLDVWVDESILPTNQKPPWSKAMFLQISAVHVVNVHAPEATIMTEEGVIAEVYAVQEVPFEPLRNSYYFRVDSLPSFVKEAEAFFNPLIKTIKVPRYVKAKIKNKFTFRLFSLALSARYCSQVTIAVSAKIKVHMGVEYFPGLESRLMAYEEKLNSKRPRVPFSSIQTLRKISDLKGGISKEACTICLERLVDIPQVRSLQCSHAFHEICIARWLVKSPLCPLCRSTVV